ncbi:enoyl-CoA hydratase/isomerase family protein [Sphingomonas sp.]|uniref:enoyl-CoA hydratase/isomerase family protein n=1 Tax=Sphingomonas sp. TaxID=28214 RepID=UPI001EB38A97|nr:enoyl-CoA hydratase/isomerase family protein [Sphingomonas sp.]MBX3595036.1 enoyl-CoA hydratase/isomerase family protein [Sphingomonas sp.]
MSDWQTLDLEREGGVAEIRLNRPDLLNRFDMQLHRELTELFGALAADPDVLSVVLSSTGRVFSAGGDTKVMIEAAGNLGHRMAMIDEGRQLFRAVADFPKPLIVALTGNSYGLGTSIILLGDAIVTTRTIEFSDPHVHMGLVAGDGGTTAWPTAMGMIRAKRHLLTGDPMSGEEAWRLGVVTDLVDTVEEIVPAARALATRIAKLPPVAVQMTKRALAKAMMARADEVMDLSFYLEALSFGSDDLLEAVAAFKEKREGVFKGR